MLECSQDLAGDVVPSKKAAVILHDTASAATPITDRCAFPVPDLDHLRGAGYAAASVGIGFLIWVFINPPGHAGWFQFSGSVAMAIAGAQQLTASAMGKPIALASLLGLGVYVFVMPHLSTFFGLGSVIFLCMAINCFFFTGVARFAGSIAILNEISVSDPQVYNFAAMINSYLFTVMVFCIYLSWVTC